MYMSSILLISSSEHLTIAIFTEVFYLRSILYCRILSMGNCAEVGALFTTVLI